MGKNYRFWSWCISGFSKGVSTFYCWWNSLFLFIGNEIAEELSEKELGEYGNATKNALEENVNNEPKNWTNKNNSKLGKITPLNRYEKK